MDLRVNRHFSVPKDLAEKYDEKIFEVNKWLESELLARGIRPSIFYFVHKSKEESERGQLARTESLPPTIKG